MAACNPATRYCHSKAEESEHPLYGDVKLLTDYLPVTSIKHVIFV
jgi:hypothetical protein